MAEFAYNNTKNASTGYMFFELNWGYHPRVLYKKDFDPRSQSKTIQELSSELQKVMTVYHQNLHHAQKLQKRGHNKGVKPWSYTLGKKIWLSSKYFKSKWNCKLEAKFLGPFWVLHLVGKYVYKLELPKK